MKTHTILFLFILTSCVTFPNRLMRQDCTGFSSDENVFLYNGIPFARIQALTYSLDGSKFVKEINIKLFKSVDQTKIPGLIKYIHIHQPNVEVEVEIDVD